MAERRGARTIRDDDDYDDELADDGLADSADDEFAGRDAGLTAAQAARAALRQIAELTGKQAEGVTGVGLLSGVSSGELASGGAAGIYRGPGDLPAVLGGSLLGTSHGCDGSDAAQLASADRAPRRRTM